MSVYDQWREIDISIPDSPIDHTRFLGLMKNPKYSEFLREMLLRPQVLVQITSQCNFSCSYCYSSTSHRPKGFMNERLFYYIAKQLSGFSVDNAIGLAIDGEPTIHPKFEQYVKILNSFGLRVALVSNGSMLQSSFHELGMNISTYLSTSKEEFEKRSKINFNQFNERVVCYLSDWWSNESQQNIDLKVYCSVEDLNQSDRMREKYDWAASFIKKAGIPVNHIDYGASKFFCIRKKNGYLFSFSVAQIVAGGLFPETELYKAPKFKHANPSDFGFCDSAWMQMAIFWDGAIGLCCHGISGETIYTRPEEIWEKPIRELWFNHPYAKVFRDNMERGKLILDGCKLCLSRYPRQECYVQGSSNFVPDVNITIGQELDLRGDGRRSLIFGFSDTIDRNGNLWTISDRSLFGFSILAQSGRKLSGVLTLEVDGIAFAPKEIGISQYVDVMVNNQKIARWTLHHAQFEKYRASFSSALLRNGKARFIFHFTKRHSPHELKLGFDQRKLGIGISRIAISEALQESSC